MKQLFKFQLSILFIGLFCMNASASEFEIKLKAGKFIPEATIDFKKATTPLISELDQAFIYRLIQFYKIPTNSEKETLKSLGIELLDYIPNKTFISRINKNNTLTQNNSSGIRSIVSLEADQKLSRRLVAKELPSWAVKGDIIQLNVKYHSKKDKLTVIGEIEKNSGIILYEIDQTNLIIIEWPINKLIPLSENTLLQWIEAIAPASTKDDTFGRSSSRASNLDSDYGAGRHYDGTGVVAALADDGIIGPHKDYEGRLTQHITSNTGNHGDMTGGLLFGAGNIDPTVKGMATGAYLHVYRVTNINVIGYDHIYNGVSYKNTLGTTITSTSYSQGNGGVYDANAVFVDQQINQNQTLMHVFSGGNSGTLDHGYGAGAGWGNISGGSKAAKNIICAGNTNSSDLINITSSRGPAEDGRIKPDLCAMGNGQTSTNSPNTYQNASGTSASTPTIAGVLAQLYQAYKGLNGGIEPESGLIKATLLNTAKDLGNPGPDFIYGWGRINGLKAVRILEDNRYFRKTISQGGTDSLTIQVPANVSQVRIMTYWTDKEGSSLVTKALVNDIDMQVINPNSTSYNPWVLDHTPSAASLSSTATRGIDSLNNVEQVTIDNPVSGNYTVRLNGTSIPQGPQVYYVLYDFIYDEVELTYPIGGEGFVPSEVETIRWDASDGNTNFTLSYSTDGGATYINISNSISPLVRFYNWTVPNSVSGNVKLKISRGSSVSESDTTLTILGIPQNITVLSVCPDTVELSWSAVTGATSYEVSVLGNKYMDSVGTSTNNTIKISGLSPTIEHWYSVKAVVLGKKGRRAYAIMQPPGTFNCKLNDDIEIINISSPPSGLLGDCSIKANTDISINIKNNSITAISNLLLNYQINGGAIVSEILPGPVAINSSIKFTFSAKANINNPSIYNITVWSIRPSDQNHFNDTVKSITEVVSSGLISNYPFVENFNTFNSCPTTTNCEQTNCSLGGGWINVPNSSNFDDIDWRTDAGGTSSGSTGPSTDYDLMTSAGKYLYLEASNSCYNKLATLISPCIDLSVTHCGEFSFAYHMYGTTMGEMHVDVLTLDSVILDVMTPVIGNQGNQWVLETIDLAPYGGDTINLRIRGITGTGFYSDLAIDAMSIINRAGCTVGIDEELQLGIASYYPVPSEGKVNLEIPGLNCNYLQMKIVDIRGQEILSETIINPSTNFKHVFDLSNMAKGLYLIYLKTDKESNVNRILLK